MKRTPFMITMHRTGTETAKSLRARTGSMFHYYLVYLLLTSSIMSTVGLCLHTILKSDHSDTQAAWQVRTLHRLEQQLRFDNEQAVGVQLEHSSEPPGPATGEIPANGGAVLLPDDAGGQLVFQVANESESNQSEQIVWTIRRNVIERERVVPEAKRERDKFVFSPGSDIQFAVTDNRRLYVRIVEPLPHFPVQDSHADPATSVTHSQGTERPTIEILLYVRKKGESL